MKLLIGLGAALLFAAPGLAQAVTPTPSDTARFDDPTELTAAQGLGVQDETALTYDVGPYAVYAYERGYVLRTITREGAITTASDLEVDSLVQIRAFALEKAMVIYTRLGQAKALVERYEKEARWLERLAESVDTMSYEKRATVVLSSRLAGDWTLRVGRDKYQVTLNERLRGDLSETRRVVLRPKGATLVMLAGIDKSAIEMVSSDEREYTGRSADGSRVSLSR